MLLVDCRLVSSESSFLRLTVAALISLFEILSVLFPCLTMKIPASLLTPRTRSAARKATMDKIMKDVLELEDDDLEGIRRIDDLINLKEADIDILTAPDTSGGRIAVPLSQKTW